LLAYAIDGTRRNAVAGELAAERVERDLERMSRERVLLDNEMLEKVARYEAHLSCH